MASTYVSPAVACATTCTSKADYTSPCVNLDGKLATLVVVKCGNTLECPTDITEIETLYDAGGMVVIPTIDGEMGEPTENVVESTINCIGDVITHYDHPYTIAMPYEITNEDWYIELAQRKYSQIFVVTKEAIGHEITDIRQMLIKEYTNNDLHQVVFTITSRRSTGVKAGAFKAKAPMYDAACEDVIGL